MRYNTENSEFSQKTVRKWFEENGVQEPHEALELISEARLKFPDFAMALKYVSNQTTIITLFFYRSLSE